MRDLLSVDRVANQIRLRRSTYQGTFLLVEGGSDKIFYERFINKAECELATVSGKPSSKLRVIAVLKILEQESGFKGILAIVDADFDRLTIPLYYSSNLLCTDTHDLESMLINSPAFDKVLTEFGSEEKVLQFNRDIRLAILESSISVGYLLWISQCDGLNLTFDGITFSKFVDEQNLQIDELKLIREVKNKSQAFSLKDEDLQLKMSSQQSNNYDPWQICCGHHLVEILSLGLRKTIGSNKPSDIEADKLELCLRLAYEESYFRDTQLYANIHDWEANNKPFKVLRSDL
ncbi:DUF4435 domain-containing protein [Nodosilinea sp. LEGE 07088]|uniref:DUF4435 domain-containing protein n=1 Tax=Nodosilinea sp. LEGE 07088 TaxID=2777968 RepID=UPI001881AA7C|nr:DUF4435 domain-containing protein [Nodosilinea sp. LEGE 07088]MBE9137062.1 DUF4435 domain-containing protein [Nodosilinea sp. LEGE 07088]